MRNPLVDVARRFSSERSNFSTILSVLKNLCKLLHAFHCYVLCFVVCSKNVFHFNYLKFSFVLSVLLSINFLFLFEFFFTIKNLLRFFFSVFHFNESPVVLFDRSLNFEINFPFKLFAEDIFVVFFYNWGHKNQSILLRFSLHYFYLEISLKKYWGITKRFQTFNFIVINSIVIIFDGYYLMSIKKVEKKKIYLLMDKIGWFLSSNCKLIIKIKE